MRNLLPKSLIVVAAVGLVASLGQPVHAQSAPDPAEAEARADAVRAGLEEANRAYNAAADELTRVTDRLQVAQDELDAAADRAEQARELLRRQAVSAYQSGGGLSTVATLLSESSDQALERIEVASVMAARQQREISDASAAAASYEEAVARFEAARERREKLAAEAEAAVRTLTQRLEEAEKVFERAEAEARRLEEQRAAAERAQRVAAQAPAASQAPTAGAQAAAAPAPVAAGVACPLEAPYTYIDSWGAPRSGGRSHKGTDIMAAQGKTVYAYTDGVISRTTPNRGLGGLAVYLQGDDGNQYYYAHLDSYSVSEGERVSAGQPIGANGSTGNASASAPHVHFEVRVNSGSVNPFSYVERACG